LLVKTAEPVTEPDGNRGKKLSDRETRQQTPESEPPDGDGTGADAAVGDGSDALINRCSDECKQSPEDADPMADADLMADPAGEG
jgi:hypothetical protein